MSQSVLDFWPLHLLILLVLQFETKMSEKHRGRRRFRSLSLLRLKISLQYIPDHLERDYCCIDPVKPRALFRYMRIAYCPRISLNVSATDRPPLIASAHFSSASTIFETTSMTSATEASGTQTTPFKSAMI